MFGGGNWEWRLPLRGRATDDVSALISVIDGLSLSLDEIDIDNCDLDDYHAWNSRNKVVNSLPNGVEGAKDEKLIYYSDMI
ncbi:hypothetical protein Tco_0350732 [Tanacetum coccineum]